MAFFEKLNESELESLRSTRTSGAPKKYHFEAMEVGDAFDIPSDVKLHSLRCMVSNKGKELGMKFRVSVKLGKVVRID